MEFGHIVGTHFVRNNEISSILRSGTMPEIDFQVGGGLIENIECNYTGSVPARIVQLTGSRQASPQRYGSGAKVDGVRISRTGANQMSNLVNIRTEYARAGVFDIRNINQTDAYLLTGSPINISGQSDNNANFLFNLENIYARVDAANSFVTVTRPVGTSNIVGRNIYASNSGTTFASNTGAGVMNTKLEGLNLNLAP
jgi:hypothetical protein